MPFEQAPSGFSADYFNKDLPLTVTQLGEDYAGKYAAILADVNSKEPDYDAIKSYRRIRDDLLNTGASGDLDQYKAAIRQKDYNANFDLADNIIADPSLSSEEKVGMLQDVSAGAGLKHTDVDTAYTEYNADNATPSHPAEKDHQLSIISQPGEIRNYLSTIQELADASMIKYTEGTKPGAVGVVSDASAYVILPGHELAYRGVLKEAFPNIAFSKADYLLPGNAKKKVKAFIDGLSDPEKITYFKDVLASIENHMGVLTDDNSVERLMVTKEMVNLFNPEEDVHPVVDNVFGVLDWAVLGSLRNIKRLLRTDAPDIARESVLANKTQTAPEQAQDLASGAIASESPETAIALGATKNEIASDLIYPKVEGQQIMSGPDLRLALEDYAKVLGERGNHINWRELERATAVDVVEDAYKTRAAGEPAIHISKSVVTDTADGFTYEATIGRTENIGFKSYDEALEYAQTFEEANEIPKFFYKDKETGVLKEFTPKEGEEVPVGTEWFARLRQEYVFSKKDLLGLEQQEYVGLSGRWARINDKSAQWARDIVKAEANAVNTHAYLNKEFKIFLKPFDDMKKTYWKQAKVLRALDEGDAQAKWFEDADLKTIYNMDDAEIEAYRGFQRVSNVMYLENNRRIRAKFDELNYKHIDTGDFKTVAKPLSDSEMKQVVRAYDPKSKSTIAVKPSDLEEFEKKGYKIMSMHSFQVDEEKKIGTYNILVAPDQIKPLPLNVLKYRGGYIPKVYKAPYKVVRRFPGIDIDGKGRGSTQFEVVRFAKTRADAERLVKEMKASNPDKHYDAQLTREFSDTNLPEELDIDYFRSSGQLFFSQRGQEVAVEGERSVANVYEAVQRMITNVTRHMSHDTWIENEMQRWYKSYNKFLADKQSGHFPSNPNMLIKPANTSEQAEYARAVAHLYRINHLRGAITGLGANIWRKGVVLAADMVSNWGAPGRYIGEKLLDPSSGNLLTLGLNVNRSPAAIAKASAFIAFIATKPIRQIMINAAQLGTYVGIDHGFKYMLNPTRSGYLAQSLALDIGMGFKNMKDNNLRKMAYTAGRKAANMDEKEFEQLIDDFYRSGLAQNIDGHQVLTALAVDRADNIWAGGHANAVGRLAKEYLVKAPLNASKAAGFKLGEYKNISAAWLFARERYRNKFPNANLSDPNVLSQIASEASEISLNMNRSGELAYQKGALSAFFQFFAIQQKTIQAMLPTQLKVGNKAISNREKLRIAAVMSGLYGTASLGLTVAFDGMMNHFNIRAETPEDKELLEMARGGMLEYGLNKLASTITGEKQQLEISKSLAPVSGLNSVLDDNGLIATLAKMPSEGLQVLDLLGASKGIAKRVADLYDTASSIYLMQKIDDGEIAPTIEDYKVLMEDSLFFVGGLSDYFKANFYDKMGRKFSQSGYPGFETTEFENWALRWFGIHDKKNLDLSRVSYELIKSGSLDDETERGKLEEHAKFLYSQMFKFALRTADNPLDVDSNKAFMRVLSLITNEAFTPQQQSVVVDKLASMIRSDYEFRFSSADENLATAILKGYGQGWITTKDQLITKLINGPDTKIKENLIEVLKSELPED